MNDNNPNHWGRKVTPVTSILTAIMSVLGFPLIIWFAIHFIEGFEKRMDNFESGAQERSQHIYSKINDFSEKQIGINQGFDHRITQIEYGCCKH